jgi:Domain of unknown function (DUF4037)
MLRPMTAIFTPGLELARLFYAEQVRPLLDAEYPGLPHSAALLGPGSEVLGFDSPRSTDHDWGPRLQLLLADADASTGLTEAISGLLAARLPAEFRGYQTVFPASGARPDSARHWVEVAGLRDWLTGTLGFDPLAGVRMLDWLATPTQVLAELTAGAVFHDGLAPACGGLTAARAALAWYPHDAWLYVLACQWQRIDQEEPFPGRCAEAGDDLGSAMVTARLVRDLVRLLLMMQRRYPPYGKWLGTAFARTPAAGPLLPLLTGAITAASWPEREARLCGAYEAAATLHNLLGLTPRLDPAIRPTYYDRPYRVLGAGRFAAALRAAITDERIRALPLTGAADQFVDSTDALADRRLLRAAVAARMSSVPAARDATRRPGAA